MVSAHYFEEKINVYLCKKTSLKDFIVQQGKPIYTDSEFAGQLYKTEPAKVSSNSTWLSSVCDSNNKVTSPSHCLSLLTHNVKQSTISYALSANKGDGTGDRYSFTLQKEERVIVPVLNMWPISTDDKCMTPSQNHLSRLPSSSWLMKTRLNEFEKPQIYCIKYIKVKG